MRPRDITADDLAYWADYNPRAVMFTAPGEIEKGIKPAPGIVTDDVAYRRHAGDLVGSYCDDLTCEREHLMMVEPGHKVCRVAMQLDDDDRANVAAGGTLWLSTWGHLPVFMVEVAEP